MVLRFFALIAVLFTFSAAHASTISGDGGLSSDGLGAFAFAGTGLQSGMVPPSLTITTDSTGTFSATGVLPAMAPPPALPTFVNLIGNSLVSTTFGDGFIEILYGASDGSLKDDFEQFLVRIDGFSGNASSTEFATAIDADITVSAVDLAPIPLPAGLPLLIAGVGAFALVRRRSSANARPAA